MTRVADWYAFHATIDPIDTADALQVALADPQQRWYGLRRIQALAAAGTLTAASWNPLAHPRGKDGQFIEKFGWVRWFDSATLKWRTGWVSDIDAATGKITVRPSVGKVEFPDAKNLYARPKPKATLDLPDPVAGTLPDKFKKVGGQGGSNPGGMYQIDGSFANDPPDITNNSKMFTTMTAVKQPGTALHVTFDPSTSAETFMPSPVDVVMVPRLDGTLNRYEVLQRDGANWYRVPNSGPVTEVLLDGEMRADLKVSAADAFGEPGTPRRAKVLADLGTAGVQRGAAFDAADIADLVQHTASPLPAAGDRFYVKKMNVPERARSEALANSFYELLGIPVPDVAVGADGTTVSSKIVGATTGFDPSNAAHRKAAQAGFVGDAWLANWDVVGQGYDNMLVDADGRVWRVDAGGALEYRAKGTPKGGNFGDQVGELASLRNPTLNPTASNVFGGISQAELEEQANLLRSIRPTQIQALADKHGMGHVGPVLIARRKNILDQLGIDDAPTLESHPELDALLNEEPPKVPSKAVLPAPPGPIHVNNYRLAVDSLYTQPIIASDWDDPNFANHVLQHDGDLWVPEGPATKSGPDGHHGVYKNLFTDENRTLYVYPGEEEVLADYDWTNVDSLVNELAPQRAAAVAEIVARTHDTPLNDLATVNVNKPDDPAALTYGVHGVSNWTTLNMLIERGRLGPAGPGGSRNYPLISGDEAVQRALWEVSGFTNTGDDSHITLRRRDSTGWTDVTLEPAEFDASGPWYLPGNDTTGEIWKSKYVPDDDIPLDPDGASLAEKTKIAAKQADLEDILDLLGPDGGLDIPGGPDDPDPDGSSDVTVFDKNNPATWSLATDDEFNAAFDDAAVAEQAAAAAVANAAPTFDKKTVHGIAASLGPGTPILSTEMAMSDMEQMKTDLLGKTVVVLPIAAYENPDWQPDPPLYQTNGIGTVVDVSPKMVWDYSQKPSVKKEVVAIMIDMPGGNTIRIAASDGAQYQKVFIPVDQIPTPAIPTFKKNGDIVVNGVKIGTHQGQYDYSGVIDGDHSLTGNPIAFQASSKTRLRNAAAALTVPVPPKPVKPKSAKTLATEEKIKKLNLDLASTDDLIAFIEGQIANVPLLPADIGPGNPLNDGTYVKKGDWVFSVKDGTYAQVKQVELQFGAKHKQNPADFLRVSIPVVQPDGTTKWKTTLRSRHTLVSAAKPGDTPFVMQTKAVGVGFPHDQWVGPGSKVHSTEFGYEATVLDTVIGGEVKVIDTDGNEHWVHPDKLAVSGAWPTLKTSPGKLDESKVASLNAELAALNDTKNALVSTLAATYAKPTPKKKKPVGTPYPGPAGLTVKQPSWLAEAREAKGLKNMKDGYVPTPGMVIRHNDGTQYIVHSLGPEYNSHKNSVFVSTVDSPGDYKWRSLSTMVVDHETMLTDGSGTPLPIISNVEGVAWVPNSGVLLSKEYTQSYSIKDPITGKYDYRQKTMSRYYIVGNDGTIYNIDGTTQSPSVIRLSLGVTRIGYIDQDAVGGKTLTLSQQPHANAQIGKVEYAVIHDQGTPSGIPLAKQATPPTAPTTTTSGDLNGPNGTPILPPPPTYVMQNTVTGETKTMTSADVAAADADWHMSAVVPAAPPTPDTTPATSTDVSATPVGDLPAWTGADPGGMESPHPPVTTSSAGVEPFTPQGGTPTLDDPGLAGAHSVVGAIDQTLDIAKSNKQNHEKKWVGTYGLADHDVIEDMMVRTQTVRDANGQEFVEVSFKLEREAARKATKTFMTSSSNSAGDWEMVHRNAKNLVPGDLLRVRPSQGGGVTPTGALKPDGQPGATIVPNAQVIAAPVLIGKNPKGDLDVYRTQIMTAGGDIGFIDIEDRGGQDTVVTAQWDATKPRITSGAKSLNPNALNDGWSVKTNALSWASTGKWQTNDLMDDGVKKAPTTSVTAAPYSNSQSATNPFGAGAVLQRDYQGVHIEYATANDVTNTLDGQTIIRVPADDPDAQRKISEAMELVGVSKAAQLPPTKAALTDLGLTKVYEQFYKTYTPGMKPNGPQDALDAIDAAVGQYMPNGPDGKPRKATLDDISMRVTKDGRVQFLVSEDVSRAVVQKNHIKQYSHTFMAADKLDLIEGVMAGESPSILSTTERFQNGIWYTGMSSGQDHAHGSAGHLFFHLSTYPNAPKGSAVVDPISMHRQLDYYHRGEDRFGSRHSDQLSWLNGPSGGELMIQRRFEADQFAYIKLDSSDRKTVLDRLHKRGVTHAPNGMLLEDFIVTTEPEFKPVDYGDEIKLTAIPDDAPAPTLAGV